MPDSRLLIALGKIAAPAGLCLGVTLLLIRDVLASHILRTLSHDHAYLILSFVIKGAFSLGALGVLAWILGKKRPLFSSKRWVHATHGGVAFGDGATGNTVTTRPPGPSASHV